MREYRLRLSLLARMAVAVVILVTGFLCVTLVTGLLGGVLSVVVWDWMLTGLRAVGSLPSVSDVTAISPPHVAILTASGVIGTVALWTTLNDRATVPAPFQSATGSVFVWGILAGCLYLTIVESTAAIVAAIETVSTIGQFLVVFGLGGALTVLAVISESRRTVRLLREQLVSESVPASERNPELDATAARLAQLADVSEPDVYVTETDRPESFTLGTAVVVSTGLLETLSANELEAVLAHEVSHLANWDSRLISVAIIPVLIADDWIDDDPDEIGDHVWNAGFGLLKRYGQLGVAILSRGREWHADAGAVALIGSPAALASALATLHDVRRTPTTDLRQWEQSIVALDVLPPETEARVSGPFRTHPPTDARIARLERLVASQA